jgi:hypothetical protein
MREECSQLRVVARQTDCVARNWIPWIVAGAVVLAAAGAAVALATDDDSDGTRSAPNTSSTTVATTPAPSTTAPVTTVPPATTVAPTTTTALPEGAPPGTCAAEAAAIRAAVDAGVPGAHDGAQVAECRLAAVDATWAIVRLEAKPGTGFAAATVVLHSSAGAWTIVDSGTGDVGCGKAPQQVLVDLGLFCTGTGGSAR